MFSSRARAHDWLFGLRLRCLRREFEEWRIQGKSSCLESIQSSILEGLQLELSASLAIILVVHEFLREWRISQCKVLRTAQLSGLVWCPRRKLQSLSRMREDMS